MQHIINASFIRKKNNDQKKKRKNLRNPIVSLVDGQLTLMTLHVKELEEQQATL